MKENLSIFAGMIAGLWLSQIWSRLPESFIFLSWFCTVVCKLAHCGPLANYKYEYECESLTGRISWISHKWFSKAAYQHFKRKNPDFCFNNWCAIFFQQLMWLKRSELVSHSQTACVSKGVISRIWIKCILWPMRFYFVIDI